MSKIICVLYDDPVNGLPTRYPRDEVPKLERYPDGLDAERGTPKDH